MHLDKKNILTKALVVFVASFFISDPVSALMARIVSDDYDPNMCMADDSNSCFCEPGSIGRGVFYPDPGQGGYDPAAVGVCCPTVCDESGSSYLMPGPSCGQRMTQAECHSNY